MDFCRDLRHLLQGLIALLVLLRCVMAAAIAAYSAQHMLVIPGPQDPTMFLLSVRGQKTPAPIFCLPISNFLFANLNMTAAISVRPGPPVRDFKREGWTRLVRGEALALFEPGHVPGVLRKGYFLAEGGRLFLSLWTLS
eukprot:1154527-Pelagomonas_calceolata.AAC.3